MTAWRLPLAVALPMALQSCAGAVQIDLPARPAASIAEIAADPVTLYQVRFGPNYRGGFRASLDGQDITAAFTPPPAPDGTSIARQGPFAAGSGVYGRFGTPTWSHELFVAGACRWYCADNAVVVDFTPPNLRFSANDFRLKPGGTIDLRIEVDRPPTRPLVIEIASTGGRGYTGAVALDREPPGTPIEVTIPAGVTAAMFSLTAGRRPGRFLVTATAPGCQGNGIYGFVTP
ncbi:MAG TPA: hypothetical protein VMU85_22415 [Stellaceae bacterium]|nr:hypothetical protein [Stellaceae bacterium]